MYVCTERSCFYSKPSYPQNTDHGNVKCSSLPRSLLSLRVCAVCKYLQVIFSCVMAVFASLHHFRGNWVEAWKLGGSIRGKIDCRMQSYADKPFIVLFFSVRSSRSSAHGRHFVIGSKYIVGEGVGAF